MLRLSLLGVLGSLIVASPAAAAPFGELSPLYAGAAASCLKATGAPGELVRSSPTGVRFLAVTPAGIADAGGVTTGVAQGECPQAAARPSGAGIVAQAGAGLWVSARDPGGAWGAPVRLADHAARAAAGVADSGAAVVAWLEPGAGGKVDVKAALRAPGGGFGPAATLASGGSARDITFLATVRAAMSAVGEAIVAWTLPLEGGMPLQAAIAPAGGAFGAPQRLGATRAGVAPALAAAPDGHALAAFWDGRAVRVSERAPGAAFGPARRLAAVTDQFGVYPAAAVGDGGAAVVVWQAALDQSVTAVARPRAGAFGAPVRLVAPVEATGVDPNLLTLLQILATPFLGGLGVSAAPADDPQSPRAALTGDGRAVVAFERGADPIGARVASFPLGGGHVDRGALGAQVLESHSVTPLTLPGGQIAAAWIDGGDDARVHAALDGRPAPPASSPPRVSLGPPRNTVLKPAEALALPVRCSAACDVRVDLPGRYEQVEFLSLPRAGTRVAKFQPLLGPVAPLKSGPVRVRVRYAAPGAQTSAERVETVTLRRLPAKRVPRVLGLEAVRRGSEVEVSWRSDVNAAGDAFLVFGSTGRALSPDSAVTGNESRRRSGRRFSARLSGAEKVRYVTVFPSGDELQIGRPVVARVR
jgi:hypothetical protein